MDIQQVLGEHIMRPNLACGEKSSSSALHPLLTFPPFSFSVFVNICPVIDCIYYYRRSCRCRTSSIMGLRTVFATAIAGLPVIQAAIPTISGFTLTWGDDFVGSANSLPNPSNWIVDTGTSYAGGPANWGTGEIQTYTSSANNLKLDGNGALQITAIKSSSGAWTSSRIETQRSDFVASAGGKMRIQASLNLPNVGSSTGIGYWPAFWTLGSSYRGNYQ